MKTITYKRYEFQDDPEERTAELSTFVYDIPYLGACGIFPPRQILNAILTEGGAEGGMGPGATWAPFALSEEEYRLLVDQIRLLDPATLGNKARYTSIPFEFDPEFDHIPDWESWTFEVCKKHRDAYHARRSGS